MSRLLVAFALVAVIGARPSPAQSRAATTCDYMSCALSIAPRWNGLAVVRGVEEHRVANLSFFWPRDFSGLFATPGSQSDSAASQARRAVRIRRIAAALTNTGAVAVAVAGTRAIVVGRLRSDDAVVLGAGTAAIAVSLPLHFNADGALSRAIWWYNHRFSSNPDR